jgi:hypothetical protein
MAERIREATLRGRPLGSKSFIRSLEESSGCKPQPRLPGRPRKEQALAGVAGEEQLLSEVGS